MKSKIDILDLVLGVVCLGGESPSVLCDILERNLRSALAVFLADASGKVAADELGGNRCIGTKD